MNIEFIVVLIALLLSALYSGIEAAFYAAHRLKVDILVRKNVRGAKLVAAYLRNPERYLSTVLIANNVVNVLFASFAAIYLSAFMNKYLVALLSSGIVLVFGEIVPKSIMRSLAERAAVRLAGIVRICELSLLPIIKSLNWLASLITFFFKAAVSHDERKLSKEDIRLLFRESRFLGHIDLAEEELVQRIMRLSAAKARKLMVPRTDIVALSVTASIAELKNIFLRTAFSRIPIYENSLDEIIGVVFALDLFKRPATIKEIVRSVPFVPETKPAIRLMQELRRRRSSIAIVIDEYGGTAGLVTLEDIFEEIFGEIADEHDDAWSEIEPISYGVYRVTGREYIETLNAKLKLDLPIGDYETLTGFIFHELGRIPRPGETIDLPTCKIVILRTSKRKINTVRIIKK